MTKIEMLQYMIEHNGGCGAVHCFDCPLFHKPKCACVIYAEQHKLSADDIHYICMTMAEQMLNDIAEKMILGINNEQN